MMVFTIIRGWYDSCESCNSSNITPIDACRVEALDNSVRTVHFGNLYKGRSTKLLSGEADFCDRQVIAAVAGTSMGKQTTSDVIVYTPSNVKTGLLPSKHLQWQYVQISERGYV